jgi:hypothetical protein
LRKLASVDGVAHGGVALEEHVGELLQRHRRVGIPKTFGRMTSR